MTQLLYQTDSYLQSFDATVTGVDTAAHGVILDCTGFYPGGGGQPADQGFLHDGNILYNVHTVQRLGGQIVHVIAEDQPLPAIETRIQGQLNWIRRYQLMRTHTALHILCGVIFRDYGASVTGGAMEPLKGHLDFEFETIHKDLVAAIETAINSAVAENYPIEVCILPRAKAFEIPDLIRTKINLLPEGIQDVRIVEIVGLDLQADGGTHVRSTSEVGQVRIADYKSKGKNNKRIYLQIKE